MRLSSITDRPSGGVAAMAPRPARSRHRRFAPFFPQTPRCAFGALSPARQWPASLREETRLSFRCFRQGAPRHRVYLQAHRRSRCPEIRHRHPGRPICRASGASGRSCNESATCRVQTAASLEREIKFIRRCQSNSVATKRSRRSTVSRETGVSSSARSRSAERSSSASWGRAGRGCRPSPPSAGVMPRRGWTSGLSAADVPPTASTPRA